MGAEVVALGLQQVRRQPPAAVAVVVAERGGDRRRREPELDGHAHDAAPAGLGALDLAREERIEQQVRQLGVLVEGALDLAEEGGADDAAAAPHERDAAVVEVPPVRFRGRAHELVALGVADELRGVERLLEVVHEALLVAREDGALGAFEHGGGGDALLLDRGEAAREHGLADERQRHAFVERGDGRPLARALLPSGVEDLVHDGLSGLGLVAEDVAGDLDEIAVEIALVPLGEDRVHLLVREAEAVLHDLVDFADELHVAVFDAVVDHLDEVARAAFADPLAAGLAGVGVRRDLLEDRLHGRPGLRRAARHDGRAEQRALLAAGDAGADVEEALVLDVLAAPDRVREVAVAAVDDDVARLEVREDLLDEVVDGLAGLDEHHHLAGALEVRAELLDAVAADELLARAAARDELVHLLDGAVVHRHGEALALHVEDEVLAHHRQSDQSDVCFHVFLKSLVASG